MINGIAGMGPSSQGNGHSGIPHSRALPRPNFSVWEHDEPVSLSLTPRPTQGPGAADQIKAKESGVTKRWWQKAGDFWR